METKDIIMTVAVIIGPIAAVQIQKLLESIREKRQRKINIFKILMTTRATRVSLEHIQALNMIDVEFVEKKYSEVSVAWRAYHDALSHDDPQAAGWVERTDVLFIELLHIMGKSLGYSFDKVMLKRTAYSPVAHGQVEYDQEAIRKGLVNIVKGKIALPFYLVNMEENEIGEINGQEQ